VGALPDDLDDGGIAARVLADERRLGVRNRLGPTLPHLENLADALYPPARGLLIVDPFSANADFNALQFLSLYAVVAAFAVSKMLDIAHTSL
jgi:hypothetical protein